MGLTGDQTHFPQCVKRTSGHWPASLSSTWPTNKWAMLHIFNLPHWNENGTPILHLSVYCYYEFLSRVTKWKDLHINKTYFFVQSVADPGDFRKRCCVYKTFFHNITVQISQLKLVATLAFLFTPLYSQWNWMITVFQRTFSPQTFTLNYLMKPVNLYENQFSS